MKYTLLFLFLIPLSVFSQGWEKTYGLGIGASVLQTADNGYVIAGTKYYSGTSFSNIYLIKTNNNGDTLWTKTYGEAENKYIGNSFKQTTDNGYIIVGNILNSNEMVLIKTDYNGELIWSKTYGGNNVLSGNSVSQTMSGGYIITGARNGDLLLLKTNNIGDTSWTKTYGGIYYDIGYSVQQTNDEGYIITGHTVNINDLYDDLYIIKTDNKGDTIWTKTYGGDSNDSGKKVQQTTDGGYIICGGTYTGSGATSYDVYMIKLDSIGNTLWTKSLGGNGSQYGKSFQQTNDGYIITGSILNSATVNDVYLLKTDLNGDTLWTKAFGGVDHDFGNSVIQTSDGGYIITGVRRDGTDRYIYLIKTDDQGNTISITEIPSINPNRKLIKTIDFLGREISSPIKNKPFIEIYDDGSSRKRFILE